MYKTELMQSSLLKGKATDVELFWKSINFTPQKSFEILRFLYCLYISV